MGLVAGAGGGHRALPHPCPAQWGLGQVIVLPEPPWLCLYSEDKNPTRAQTVKALWLDNLASNSDPRVALGKPPNLTCKMGALTAPA